MVTSESIIEELVNEHGINSITVPCPCTCGHPMPADKTCPYCNGDGKVQYGIDGVEFFS